VTWSQNRTETNSTGILIYNGRTEIEIPDRTLTHLQAVFIDKLRRLETFSFCWDDGSRRYVLWLAPSIPVEFVYSGNRVPALNRRWLEMLAMAAGASGGLIVMPEPPMPQPAAQPMTQPIAKQSSAGSAS